MLTNGNGTHSVLWKDDRRKFEDKKWLEENTLLAKQKHERDFQDRRRSREEVHHSYFTHTP